MVSPPRFWLKGMALQKWRELAQTLTNIGAFTELDVDIVADAAQHWALMVDAKNAIEKSGVIIENARGP